MQINFGAIYRGSTTVKKVEKGAKKEDLKVSVAELENDNIYDLEAIEEVAEKFSHNNSRGNYAKNICDSFSNAVEIGEKDKDTHYYVLTLQNSDYDILEPDKILGTFMVKDKRTMSQKRKLALKSKTDYVTKIQFLQGTPDSYYENPERKYSGTGKAMTDFVKQNFKTYDIALNAAEKAIPFYLSQGFKQSNDNPSCVRMIYYA